MIRSAPVPANPLDLIRVCHRLYEQAYVAAYDGNVSIRLANGNILITAAGKNKGEITRDDLVEITPEGKRIRGAGKPSTEHPMHLTIYRERTDIGAVVHAHPPLATAFAAARIPLPDSVLPEVIVGLGPIPLAPYATPSTDEVGESVRPFLRRSKAILLANHGVVAFSGTVWDAYYALEKVEQYARIISTARSLGGERPLSEDELSRLRAISEMSYGKSL